jgi:hypothetical protein
MNFPAHRHASRGKLASTILFRVRTLLATLALTVFAVLQVKARNPPAVTAKLRKSLPSPPRWVLLLLVGFLGAGGAYALPVTVSGVLIPSRPSFIDPTMLTVTVSGSSGTPTGSITYSVDGGAAGTATLTNGIAAIPLGTYAVGAHSVSYTYTGNYGTSDTQLTTFTAADLTFNFVASQQVAYASNGGIGFVFAAADSGNNILITGGNSLYKLDLMHNLTTVTTAGLSSPQGIAIDSDDNVYLADYGNNRIVKLTPFGVQTTLGVTGLLQPRAIALDPAGTSLYINDDGNGRIVKYTFATNVTAAVVTGIPRITSLAVDAAGNLFFGQHYSYGDGTLFKLDTNGNLTSGYYGLRSPEGLAFDSAGNLYSTDDYGGLSRVDAHGHFTQYAGLHAGAVAVDHQGQFFVLLNIYSYVFTPGPAARLGIAFATGLGGGNSGPAGDTMIYQLPENQTLASLDLTTGGNGLLGQVGGINCGSSAECDEAIDFGPSYPGQHSGFFLATSSGGTTLQTNFYGIGLNSNEAFDPGARSSSSSGLLSIGGLAEAEDHTIYASDTSANVVYSLGVGGVTPAAALPFAGLNQPTQLTVDGSKSVFVLDSGNDRVLKLTSSGTQTMAYAGGHGGLSKVTAFAMDGSGTLYLGGRLTSTGSGIVSLDVNGNFTALTSTPGDPAALAVDGAGGLYEADSTSSTLRRYATFATTQTPATLATGVSSPTALAVEPSGTVFVAQGPAGTLLEVRSDGSTEALYSGLAAVNAVVEDGRGVLTLADNASGSLLIDDRRTGSYTFGPQTVQTTSSPVSGTITNDGNLPLGGIGGLPGDATFQQVAEAGACFAAVPDAGTSLAVGALCKLDYTFTPTSVQTYNESGTEQDSTYTTYGDFTYRSVAFTGAGVNSAAPVITLAPATLTFAPLQIGNQSAVQTITVSNTGTASATLTAITLSGPDAINFALTSGCGGTLAAGRSCTLSVTFSPNAARSFTATVQMASNDPASPASATLAGTGLGVATAMLTPAALSFTSANAQTATLTNNGTAALAISNVALSGPNAGSFTLAANNCGASLAAGNSCQLSIGFINTAPGSYLATLTVSDNATPATQTVQLTGTVTGVPQPTLTPPTLTFGSITVGTTSAAQTLTLSNTGTAALTFSSSSIYGTNPASFAETNACPATLAAGASCTISVTCTPAATGPLSASLGVNFPSPTAPVVSTLSCTGAAAAAPQAVLAPASLSFTSVVNSVPPNQTATLSNPGTGPLTIASVAIGGANASSFAIVSNNCGTKLAANATCTITVGFSVVVVGTYKATLTVTDNASPTTQTVALMGKVDAPAIKLTPTSLTFPDTQIGSASASKTITVSNTGTSEANLTAITLGGAGASSFTETNSCGATLAVDGTCLLTFTFIPTAANQTFNATVTVVSSDPASPATATLTGKGIVAGLLTIAPATQVFPSASVTTTSAVQTSIIANGTPQAVSLSTGTLTDATDFTATDNCNGLIDAGKTCVVSFTFTPQTTGALTSTYKIHDLNAPGTPLTVLLSGNATPAPAPIAKLGPSSLSFSTTSGTAPAAQTLTLSNTGNATLSIASVVISGASAKSFTQTTSCGTSLAAGKSCSLTIGFTGSTAGSYAATVTVTDNASPTTQSSTLAATVTGTPQAALTPASANFGTIDYNATATQILTLSNKGTAVLPIDSTSLATGPFSLTGSTCATTLPAGSSCTYTITFTGTAAGAQTATFSVTDSVGTQSSALSGTVNPPPAPEAALTPPQVNFRSVITGTTTTAQKLTLANAGNAALSITSATLGGATPSDFAIASNSCGSSLAAGATCTIAVTFTPGGVGAFNATLSVVDAVGTQTSALTGAGIAPPDFTIVATPRDQSSYLGTSVMYSVQLAPLAASNPFNAAIALTAAGLPPGAAASFSPASVTPSAGLAVSKLTVTIPALSAASPDTPAPKGQSTAITFAALALGLIFLPRKRRILKFAGVFAWVFIPVVMLSAATLCVSLTGCGSGNGFAVPTSTSTITITGTSGTTVHSTTVTLTLK